MVAYACWFGTGWMIVSRNETDSFVLALVAKALRLYRSRHFGVRGLAQRGANTGGGDE